MPRSRILNSWRFIWESSLCVTISKSAFWVFVFWKLVFAWFLNAVDVLICTWPWGCQTCIEWILIKCEEFERGNVHIFSVFFLIEYYVFESCDRFELYVPGPGFEFPLKHPLSDIDYFKSLGKKLGFGSYCSWDPKRFSTVFLYVLGEDGFLFVDVWGRVVWTFCEVMLEPIANGSHSTGQLIWQVITSLGTTRKRINSRIKISFLLYLRFILESLVLRERK